MMKEFINLIQAPFLVFDLVSVHDRLYRRDAYVYNLSGHSRRNNLAPRYHVDSCRILVFFPEFNPAGFAGGFSDLCVIAELLTCWAGGRIDVAPLYPLD
jgi:hypothetical protein